MESLPKARCGVVGNLPVLCILGPAVCVTESTAGVYQIN